MKAKTNLLARSIKHLEAEGWTCGRTEHFNFYTNHKEDYFGIIDAICCRPGTVLGVQTTDHTSASKHRKKMRLEPRTRVWLASGASLVLHSWKKVGARWALKSEEIV